MAYDPNLLTATRVESTTFRISLRGYDPDEVDALMVRVYNTLSRHESESGTGPEALTADQVKFAAFSTTIRGYDLDQVDDLLDDVVATLQHYESGTAGNDPPVDPSGERVAQFGTANTSLGRKATLSSQEASEQEPGIAVEPDADRSDSILEDEAVEEHRPRSSEELLEQAKKWLDRS